MRGNGNRSKAQQEVREMQPAPEMQAFPELRDQAAVLAAIMGQVSGAEIRRRHGAKFRFRFYLTKSMSETGIESLELSVRAFNSLRRAGIRTIGELAEAVAGEENILTRIRNCGKKSAEEIMIRLFIYQYETMKPEKRDRYLAETVLLNLGEQAEKE